MDSIKITKNPTDLKPVVQLFKEIFKDTLYDKTELKLQNEWNNKIKKGDLILTLGTSKLNLPLAFAVLTKDKDILVIEYVGVKEGYRNQGLWKHLYNYILKYAELNNFKNLGIENNPTLFSNMDRFIKNNNFIEDEKVRLENGDFSITYIKILNYYKNIEK